MTDENAKKTGGVIAALGAGWFWFSQATSIIGLVGIIEDLETWGHFATWLMQQVDALAPALRGFLAAAGSFIHAGLDLFRSIFRPVFDFLLGWLPFDVPQIVKDALVVAAFMALGARRVYGHTHAGWGRLVDSDYAALREKARAFGLEVSDRPYGSGGVSELQSGIHALWRLRGVPFPVTLDELRQGYERDVEKARLSFGARFDNFADQNRPDDELNAEASRLLASRRNGLIFVFALAALTITVVAYDFFVYQR